MAITCAIAPVVSHAQAPAQAKPPADSPKAGTEQNKPTAAEAEVPAQIELLETHVRFEVSGESRKEVHARVHLNNELGVRQFARLNFDYNRAFQQVELPLMRITHAGGGTADILPSAVTDQPNPAVVNYPAYHDVRVKSVRILGLEPGDLLEYRVVTTTAHHPLAPDFWLDHTFDRSGVVSQELFELDLPGHVNYSTTTMGHWTGSPSVVVYMTVQQSSYHYDQSQGGSGRTVYRWEIPSTLKLPPAVDQDGAPAPDVLVSSFGDWYMLVRRLNSALLNRSEEDSKAAAAQLRAYSPGARSSENLIRAGYEFASQKLATVDLPLGATGFRLRHLKEIFNSGYATREEKASVLAQLASEAGIKAEIVLTAAPETQKQFGRPSAFTHIFVVLSDKKKFVALDPSLEVAPFGSIPPEFRSKTALSLTLVDADDVIYAKWLPLPSDLPFSATQRVDVDAAIATDGALTAKIKYSMRGDNELMLRVAFHQAPKEKWKEVAQVLALSDGFRGKVTSVTASDPYATKEPFTVEYEITQPKFVDWTKKPVRIPALLPAVTLPEAVAKSEGGAASPVIELGSPLDVVAHVALHVPPETSLQAPVGRSVEREYASFSSEYSARNLTLTAGRHIKFRQREVPAGQAADYAAFVRSVQSDEAQEFTLERSASSAQATRGTPPGTASPQP